MGEADVYGSGEMIFLLFLFSLVPISEIGPSLASRWPLVGPSLISHRSLIGLSPPVDLPGDGASGDFRRYVFRSFAYLL